jgi:FKBP-type peptidyl-prolyl cis-trans isomerase FkpA
MKKVLLILTITALFNSCKSDFEKELELLQTYLDKNNIDTEPTKSGLYYIEKVQGTGDFPEVTDVVKVHYEGRLLSNDEIFDSSYERGEPAEFTLGQLIPGWIEGISYMKEGGEATLIIPSDLAYGQYGSGSIPGYSTLIFEIELLEIL